ncbi:microtubule-associated protein 10 [Tachyglossus aculeatus]|uniref:microtubule-associated protein 10 n=1 Tax=Tachyglossus aculeatus TaxID=9261 RepID=UPI0018F43FC6|nr:microtubule-associated protein 10 [Tachyglossus aculeatus]
MAARDAERMFALELLVDRVCLEARGLPPALGGFLPSVAFRLLDFPTLLVPAPPQAHPQPGIFAFGRGKSCLLRLGPAALVRMLGRAPLCALLLAPPAGGAAASPRLLGSCCVSLATVAGGHRGRYALRDLMGARVGDITLGFRLIDLGSCPVDHLLQEALPPDPEPQPQLPHPCPGDVEDGRPRMPRDALPGVGTQTPATPHRRRSSVDPDGMEPDTFCPPPLFYTRPVGEGAAPAASPGGPGPPPGAVGEARGGLREEAISGPSTEAPGKSDAAAARGHRPDGLRRLPLLRALLRELSLLDGRPEDGTPQDAATQAPEFSTRPAGQPVRQRDRCQARGRERSPGLPLKRDGGPGAEPPGSLLQARAGKGPEDGPKKAGGARENRRPRKKLVFGLTKTLRLRLGQTNPEVLLLHERRERAKKKRLETLRGRKFGSPSSRGKTFRPAEDNWEPVGKPGPVGNSDPIAPWGEKGGTLMPRDTEADSRGCLKEVENQRIEAQTGLSGEGEKVANKFSLQGSVSWTPGTVRSALGSDAQALPPGASPPDAGIQRDTIDQEVRDGPSQVKAPGFTGPSPEGNGPREASPLERYSDDFTSACSSGALSSADAGSGGSGTLRVRPELEGANPESAGAEADSQASASGTSGNTYGSGGTSAPLPPLSAASWSPSSSGTPRVASCPAPSPAGGDGSSVHGGPSPLWGRDGGQSAAPRARRNTGAESHRDTLGCQEATRWARALETSQSPRTSLVSSYVLTSSVSEEEVSAPNSPSSILSGEGVDKLGSLNMSSQYRDIRELVINKLPGYTV